MLGFSYRRAVGGRRYSSTDRTVARDLTARARPSNFGTGFVASFDDPDGIRPLVDVVFELESNRLRRPTTVALYRGAVSVGARHGAETPLSAIVSGKRNPSHVYAIADSSPADLSYVFAAADGMELPTAFADDGANLSLAYLLLPGGGVDLGNVGSGRGAFRYNFGTLTAVGYSGATGDAGRISNDRAAVYVVTPTAGQTGTLIEQHSTGRRATLYRIPPSGSRTFTVGADLRVSGGDAIVRGALTIAGTGVNTPTAGAEVRVPASTGAGSMSRFVWQITVTGTPGSTITLLAPKLELMAGSTATRIELADFHAHAGAERSPERAGLASIPAADLLVQETWTDPRSVNRVEVFGEYRASAVTAVSIDVRTTVAGAWSLVAAGEGSGRLAVDIPEALIYGIRVHVEETTGGETGLGAGGSALGTGSVVWLSEVDPMLIRDVTDQVESLDLEWTREADPGQSTTPVGNYQASSLSIELEDTAGTWDPAVNASLDVGHRIEVAVGTRRSNVLGNPRAAVDATGYASGVTRWNDGAPPDAPAVTGLKTTAGTGATVTRNAETVPATSGSWRLTGWIAVEGTGATGKLGIRAYNSAGTLLSTTLGADTIAEASGWIPVAVDLGTLPAGTASLTPTLRAVGGAADSGTLFVTRLALRQYTDATFVTPVEVEELVSAGVFYSLPFDTDSASETVTIEAVDRLGRESETIVEDAVREGQDVGSIVADLALTYLDLDEDQLSIATSTGSYVIPYAYPTGPLGAYLADLAKGTVATLHVDSLERLVLAARADTTTDTVAEIRDDSSLIRHRRPPGLDVTTAIVEVTASPMVTDVDSELWTLPAPGLSLPSGSTREILAPYGSPPAVDGYVSGVVADGAYTVTSSAFYSDRAVITVRNDEARTLILAAVTVRGLPLVAGELVARVTDAASVARYGRRTLTVDAPMIQTQARVDLVAAVLLDTFRAIGDDGIRRVPEVTFDALGLLHIETGDRVAVAGSEYSILGRRLVFEGGALLLNDVRARETPPGSFLIADVGIADDVYIVGY